MILALLQGHGPADPHADEKFDAGKKIIEHISNTPHDHALIHLPPVFGIDFSVTKHVFMLWVVAAVVLAVVLTAVRRHQKRNSMVPSGMGNVLEYFVEAIRDNIALPNFGKKWVRTWTPLILTFFLFIFSANLIGLIPIFDVIGLLNHYVLHQGPDTFISKVVHGGTTATANYDVTAGLAVITFFAIIQAGSKAHGVIHHFKNLVPHGLPAWVYIILVPIEVMGMFVKPFALTMRLAANMTGGHIAILAILSFVFLFAEMFKSSLAGVLVGVAVSVPLAVGISGLELIVILVQAYV